MEKSQKTIRKLLVFAAVIVLCGGVPHFLFGRGSFHARYGYRSPYALETVFPSAIGDFHLVNRWQTALQGQVVEQVAIYQDVASKETAQFAIYLNAGAHNAAACYLARGMQMQSRRVEQLQTADSIAGFEIVSIVDQSVAGTDGASLLMATTECGGEKCTSRPLDIKAGPQLTWLKSNYVERDVTANDVPVPLSITFESSGNSGNGQGQDQAKQHFRKLLSNFNLKPLRELSAGK
jgi:hypothetical protein